MRENTFFVYKFGQTNGKRHLLLLSCIAALADWLNMKCLTLSVVPLRENAWTRIACAHNVCVLHLCVSVYRWKIIVRRSKHMPCTMNTYSFVRKSKARIERLLCSCVSVRWTCVCRMSQRPIHTRHKWVKIDRDMELESDSASLSETHWVNIWNFDSGTCFTPNKYWHFMYSAIAPELQYIISQLDTWFATKWNKKYLFIHFHWSFESKAGEFDWDDFSFRGEMNCRHVPELSLVLQTYLEDQFSNGLSIVIANIVYGNQKKVSPQSTDDE